ncbi:prephenate dehydrogenase [candidate division NPL-UPA2 bacterium]|nr:prephenate dehydrogenase [candidate division NPL-UPA2 bacterium]
MRSKFENPPSPPLTKGGIGGISRGRIAIVGVGLIGGSLGLALKKQNLVKEVVGIGRRQESLDKAIQVGAVDRVTLSLEEGVKNVDLVVVATPVGLITEMIKRMITALPQGAIITDVGSTKEKIVQQVDRILPEGISFVGGHPLAGSEKRGVGEARADLFENSVCVLTPGEKTSSETSKIVKLLWEGVGAKVLLMKPKEHDFLLAATSHLPHLLAATLVNLMDDLSKKDDRLPSLIAGGFKDTTRIAASFPELWRDICLDNRDNLTAMIDKFKELLEEVREHISNEDSVLLGEDFAKAKAFRDKL